MRDFLQLSIVLDESPAKFFATPVRHYTLGRPRHAMPVGMALLLIDTAS